jgi:hypothetical protein
VVGPRSRATWNRCRTGWRRFRKPRPRRPSRPRSASRCAKSFTSFGPAVAAASIAQVHRAEADGPRRRKGAAARHRAALQSDLDTLYFAARTAERHSAEARRLKFVEVVDTLARSVTIEMDLRLEAAAIAEMRDNVKDDPDFRVPESTGSAPRAGADARMDRRHAAHRPRQARGRPDWICRRSAAR